MFQIGKLNNKTNVMVAVIIVSSKGKQFTAM
jgi:hypothetical protein